MIVLVIRTFLTPSRVGFIPDKLLLASLPALPPIITLAGRCNICRFSYVNRWPVDDGGSEISDGTSFCVNNTSFPSNTAFLVPIDTSFCVNNTSFRYYDIDFCVI